MVDYHALDPADMGILKTLLQQHFSAVDEKTILLFEQETRLIHLKAGEHLFNQHDQSDDIYFVLTGRLRASIQEKGGKWLTIGEIGRGETIGELALITGEPRSATITAIRDTHLAKLERAAFERVLTLAPQMAMQMMKLVVQRFRRAERARKPPLVPVTICLLPITHGVDASGFAHKLANARKMMGDRVSVLTRSDFELQSGVDREADAQIAQRIRALEVDQSAVLLVADPSLPAWTERCVQEADEILLLADSEANPVISAEETDYLDAETPIPIARQTLVLLHAPDKQSPHGTARWLDRRPVDRHIHIRPDHPADMARIARILSGRAIGIVLSGGAARGLSQIGVIKALEEFGIEADFVGGTSMGSVIAAWHAMEVKGNALIEAGKRAFGQSPSGDFNLLPILSLVRGKRTLEITRAEIITATGQDIDTEDCWKTYFCIASDYTNSVECVLNRGVFYKNVVASYSIPGVFPPQLIDAKLMFDGGSFNNFPVDIMEKTGAGVIIGVDMLMEPRRPVEITALPKPLELALDLLRPRKKQRFRLPNVMETLLNATFVSSTARQRLMQERVDLYIRPDVKRIGMLDWKKLPNAVEQGYAHTKAQLSTMTEQELARFRVIQPLQALTP
jgi:NTE family protein